MYKNPIELIYKDIQYRMEKDILYAIQKVDINVDRDELLKALAYDRGQYEKGYEDAKAERKKGKWLTVENPNYSPFDCSPEKITVCSVCGYTQAQQYYNYCPYCGTDMREETTDE